MKNCSLLFSLILFILIGTKSTLAQDLGSAKRLSATGSHQQAEQIFQQLLIQSPDNPDLLIASAYNYSWMGKQNLAIKQFRKALSIKEKDTEGLIGLGYAYAWNKDFINARLAFTSILNRNPRYLDAMKGIAYSYLWQGNGEAAVNYFRRLSRNHPGQAEFFYAEGIGYRLLRKGEKAAKAFKQALKADPNYAPAKFQMQSIQESIAKYSISAMGGYSALGLDENVNKFGLRTVHASARFDKGWQAYLKFDNTLSLDLTSFALQNQTARALSVGIVKDWNKNLLSELEYGQRYFPEKQVQHFIKGAQVFFFPHNWHIKTGGFIGLSSTIENEWMGFVSVNIPTLRNLRIEPTYYHLKTAFSPATEHRIQVGALYRFPSGFELNAYGLWGTSNLDLENRPKHIKGWSLFGLFPLTTSLFGQFVIRQEQSPLQDFTSIAAGLKYNLIKTE